MKCPKCGAEVGVDEQFCGECGTALRPAGKITKTALGLNENTEGLLCYLLGWLTGIIFLLLERENKFVRFHAIQSIATFLSLSVILLLVGPETSYYDPVYGWTSTLNPIFGLIILLEFILWVLLMYKAYKGEKFKLPIIGGFAEKQS